MWYAEKRWNAKGSCSWCLIDGDNCYPFGDYDFAREAVERYAKDINEGRNTGRGFSDFGDYKYKHPVHQLKVEQNENYPGNSVWGIKDDNDGHFYPFGCKESSENVLKHILEGTDHITDYGYYGLEEDEKAEIQFKEPVPEYGPWVTIGREGECHLEENTVHWEKGTLQPPSPVQPPRYYQFNPTGESSLLLGQVGGQVDGQRVSFSSRCANCGFTRVSAEYNSFCSQCQKFTMFTTTSYGSGTV